ncbi:MAG TPA: hypothetical protein VKC51_10900 [Lacunisphaera sp.]|nr:hypothetical protein [Lacunisphaera sp.]
MNPTPKTSLAVRLAQIALYLGILGFLWLWSMSVVYLPGRATKWLEWPLILALLGTIVSIFWGKIRMFGTWRCAGIGAALFGSLLVWLAWDDAAFTHPLTLNDLSPAPNQAAESYQLTLAYTQIDGKAARGELPSAKFSPKNSPDTKLEAWRAEIVKEREKVATEWTALTPVRDWVGELDRFPAIGDFPEATYDSRIMNTSALRRVVDFACAQAALLALDGKGDEACATLRPVLSVLFKLERHGRSEVRLLAASRSINRACVTAQFVLATTPVSAAERTALAAIITERDTKSVAHRLAWLPYVFAYESILKNPGEMFSFVANEMGARQTWAVTLMSVVRPFILLPKQTANLIARFSGAAEQVLLEPGSDSIAYDSTTVLRELNSPSPKNFGGRVLIMIATPNYRQVGENLRNGEAARFKLLEALKKN